MSKTIEVSDETYDRLVAADCCGTGIEDTIACALNAMEAYLKIREIQPKGRKKRPKYLVLVKEHQNNEGAKP